MSDKKLRILKPTKQRLFKKRIFGFDIETCNNNKDFVLASIVGENYKKVFYSKEEVINELKTCFRFRNSVIFATNLSFDFFGTFFGNEDKHFKTLFRGSNLLSAKTYFKGYDFSSERKSNHKDLKSLEFIDSLNYACLSVSEMGKKLNIPKFEAPLCLGKVPNNKDEWNAIKEYNLRDSEITFKFMKFLIPSFEKLGATFKQTIASTSMALFRNKYLIGKYIQPSEDILEELFKAYYGGRTEAFGRGYFENQNYYDFNSLYPSVMKDFEYPDPNTLRVTTFNDTRYINNYEGVSFVDLYCPYMKYPLLPFKRDDGRLLFPIGNLSGYYSHVELREAVKLGYKIKRVHKTFYFLKTIKPFVNFIDDLYSLRLKYKSEHDVMEYVVKITMNSLYGKFGQKFKNKDNVVHGDTININDIKGSFEEIGHGYFRVVQDCKPAVFCVPIWAVYITAYARLKLHQAIIKYNPIYVDTDSLITRHEIEESKELGGLKLEMKIKEGIVVRPKFYALKSIDKESKCINCGYELDSFIKQCPKCYDDKFKYNHYVKIKGLRLRLNYLEFRGLLTTQFIEFDKFTKFKEAIRRDLIPNQIIEVFKNFSLEDSKRSWDGEFKFNEYNVSEPLDMDTTDSLTETQKKRYERDLYYQEKNKNKEFIESDIFDKHAVGYDISNEEFIENEKYFAVND